MEGKELNLAGSKIRRLRPGRRLSQQALANPLETEAVYIGRGSASRSEDQFRTVTDVELVGFAKIFRVPISELFE